MARSNEGWVSLGPLKGQNTSDNPLTLGEGWATDTLNIVLDPLSSVAVKRRGSTPLGVPSGTYNLARHVPIGSSESDDELWAFSNYPSGPLQAWRKIGSAGFVQMPGYPPQLLALRPLSFNGKLFIAGVHPTDNRLTVWDGTMFRFVGLKGSATPPTVTDGPAVAQRPVQPRWYRTDWVYLNTGQTQSRSELSPAQTFTNALNFGATITRQAISEHATHWRAWGSADGAVYFKLSGNIPIATTTFDDLLNPLSYAGEVAPEIGAFLPPPLPTRIITDGHRLLMAGNGASVTVAGYGETEPRTNRVWYTPVLGTLDQGDDERIPMTSEQRNFLDIGDPPTGDICELGGPMEGQIFGFAKHRTWRLIPTGDLTTPYVTYPVTMVFGAGEHPHYATHAAVLGETESGQPAIYFFDDSAGLYRITAGEDVQFVSADIQTEVIRLRPRLAAAMSVFSWPEHKQTWWILPLHTPIEQRIYVFHWEAGVTEQRTVHGGWTKWIHAESIRFAGCLLHNRTPGLDTPQGRARVPYTCPYVASVAYVWDRDQAIDGSTPYIGSLTCAPLLPAQAHEQLRVMPPTLVTTPHLMTRLSVSSVRDFGTETRSADIWLAPEGDETAVVRTAEGLHQGDCTAIQITIADPLPTPELWQIYLATMPVGKQQMR